MLTEGGSWSSDQWADARLSQAFGARIPAELSERSRHIGHAASKWVSEQHIPVGGVVTADGKAPFEPDRKLLWHWLVREELRGRYGDGAEGLPVQRALAFVMGRAIEGRIPASVWEGDAQKKWDPAANTIDGVANEGEDLARYEHWLAQFRVQQELDPYYPKHPTVLGRRFDLQREIPETEVVALIETLLDSAARNELLDVVEAKLGRPLEAHDVYFEELGDDRPSRELDAIVAERFPDEDAFDAALPEVLRGLGFGDDEAEFLGTRIDVEIARGAGHAVRPALPEFHSWLRTNRLPDTLGWDGFDTGMHELGHCLEQVISTHRPRPALRGVPNTACTEAFAFLYQHQARAVLGIAESGDRAGDIAAATSMLNACQIAGPALLEIRHLAVVVRTPRSHASGTARRSGGRSRACVGSILPRSVRRRSLPPDGRLRAFGGLPLVPRGLRDWPGDGPADQNVRGRSRFGGRDDADLWHRPSHPGRLDAGSGRKRFGCLPVARSGLGRRPAAA